MFTLGGDYVKPSQELVANMLDRGMPVLIYAGDMDFVCNWVGQEEWTTALEWRHHDKFKRIGYSDWMVDGKKAGQKKNVENFTFVRVFGAGHMVPHNKPKEALKMVNAWLAGHYDLKDLGTTHTSVK
jgi:cathepsin A (carboxypeptidase C)